MAQKRKCTQRKNQPPNVRSGKGQPNRRSNRLRRFSSGSKERCPRSAAQRDTGMSADEGLALFTPADLQNPKYSYLFLPTPPPGTTGLGRRLNPDKYYFACRWNYNDTPREFLRRALARVENPANGRAADARPVDWGPHISTGRVADLSPGLAAALGLQTDDVVRITISALRAIAVKPAIAQQPSSLQRCARNPSSNITAARTVRSCQVERRRQDSFSTLPEVSDRCTSKRASRSVVCACASARNRRDNYNGTALRAESMLALQDSASKTTDSERVIMSFAGRRFRGIAFLFHAEGRNVLHRSTIANSFLPLPVQPRRCRTSGQNPQCLDILVTQDGTKNGIVVGWITNVMVLNAATI